MSGRDVFARVRDLSLGFTGLGLAAGDRVALVAESRPEWSVTDLLSNVTAAVGVLGVTADDVALSFLPLSHAFERMLLYAYLYAGATVAFAESPATLARDMVKVRPTLMTAVPRVFEKLYAHIQETLAGRSP